MPLQGFGTYTRTPILECVIILCDFDVPKKKKALIVRLNDTNS